ncbi:MAG TPA: TRAP transporter substrate-binding protein DctP [Sphingomonas sp.]|nr:TRAP transporter substrate-binding protein DctP [Sphingomonas sp.]
MRRLLRLAALAALALAGCQKPDPAVTTLTYATPYPPGHPFSRADQQWMAWVEQASHGRLDIKPFWGGALLSSDQSMEEIRHGVADIGLITPIYALGGAHAQRAQAGFYGGVRSIDEQVAIYKCLAARFPELRKELDGLHVLAVQGGNFPAILTRERPIRSLADLRGLRLRAPSENLEVLRALGVDPVDMPMGDVYPALAKGVIDGVVAPADTLKSLHFAEVAHHFAQIRVSRGAYPARAMDETRWETLPPDLRAILTRGERVWEAALRDQVVAAEAAGLAFGKTHGVSFTTLDPADQARFDALYNRNAEASARALGRLGIHGQPIFHEAQRLIRTTPPGKPPTCDATAALSEKKAE